MAKVSTITTRRGIVVNCNALQALRLWCEFNQLEMSIGKCKVLSLFRKSNPIMYKYRVDEVLLGRLREYRDLGAIITDNLCFNKHVAVVVSKAYPYILGFMKWLRLRLQTV